MLFGLSCKLLVVSVCVSLDYHSLLPAFHHLPNREAGCSPPLAGIHLPSLTLSQAIKLLLQDRGGEKDENSAQRAVEGKWESLRTGSIDKSGREEMCMKSGKLPRQQSQANGPPHWVVHRKRLACEGLCRAQAKVTKVTAAPVSVKK